MRGGERFRCSGSAWEWGETEPGGLERNGTAEGEVLRRRDSQSCIEGRGVSAGPSGKPCPPRVVSGSIQASPNQALGSNGQAEESVLEFPAVSTRIRSQ